MQSSPVEYDQFLFSPKEENIKRIKSLNDVIFSKLQLLQVESTNFLTGKFSEPQLNRICFSINLRNTSINYHFDLLLKASADVDIYLNNVSTNFLINKKRYLFDSLIFNIVSGIDYCACLCNYILFLDQDYKRSWRKTYARIKALNDSKFDKLLNKTATLNHWFIKLNDYRAELIHYEIDNVGHTAVHDLQNCTTDLTIYPPYQFQKAFREVGSAPKEGKSIESASLWAIACYKESAIKIIKLLIEHIHQNKRGDFDIIRYGKDT